MPFIGKKKDEEEHEYEQKFPEKEPAKIKVEKSGPPSSEEISKRKSEVAKRKKTDDKKGPTSDSAINQNLNRLKNGSNRLREMGDYKGAIEKTEAYRNQLQQYAENKRKKDLKEYNAIENTLKKTPPDTSIYDKVQGMLNAQRIADTARKKSVEPGGSGVALKGAIVPIPGEYNGVAYQHEINPHFDSEIATMYNQLPNGAYDSMGAATEFGNPFVVAPDQLPNALSNLSSYIAPYVDQTHIPTPEELEEMGYSFFR